MTGKQFINKFKTQGLGAVLDTLNGKVLFGGRAITHVDEYPNTGLKFEAIDHTGGAMAFWFESGMKGDKSHDIGISIDKNGKASMIEHIIEMTEEARRRGYTTMEALYSDISKYKVGPERDAFAQPLRIRRDIDTSLPFDFDENVIIDKLRTAYPGLEDLYEMAMNGNSRPIQDREAGAKLQELQGKKFGLKDKLMGLKLRGQKKEDRSFGEK